MAALFSRTVAFALIVFVGLAIPADTPAWAQSATIAELDENYLKYQALDKAGKYREAIPHAKRALELGEKEFGPEHENVSIFLNNLALLYNRLGRYGEAEPVYKRSLIIKRKALGPEHPSVGTTLNNLAELYREQGRFGEAEPIYKRSLVIIEKALGPVHASVATALNNLAVLYRAQLRYGEAEPLYKRSLRIYEKALGPKHPLVGQSLHNLAALNERQGRFDEAEPLYKRSLAIREKALGPDHPDVAISLNNLALLYFAQSDWARAADHWRHATDVLVRRAERGGTIGSGVRGKKESEVARNSRYFRYLVQSVFRAHEENRQARPAVNEMFKTAQWAMGSEAAGALAQMSARTGAGNSALAGIVRERQDKVGEWQGLEKRMNRLRGAGKSFDKLAAQMARLDRRIGEIDKRLAKDFPEYAALANPKPLSIERVQKLLGPDEALVLLLDTPKAKPIPAETFIWAITRDKAVWKRAELGGTALAGKVTTLRCGLDASNWTDPSIWPDDTQWDKQARAAQQARRDTCIKLTGKTSTDQNWPPFDFNTAHALYQKLFSPVGDVIREKNF